MGKVYTPEQVSANQVPILGAHEKAATQILDDLKSSPITTEASNALIFGSTATGKADQRSDLDLLVTYQADSNAIQALLDEVATIIDEAAIRYGVVPEFKALPKDRVTTGGYEDGGGTYRTDPLLAAHLIQIHEQYPHMSHNNPIEELEDIALDLYNLHEATPEQKLLIARLAVEYTEGKRDMFEDDYAHSLVTNPERYYNSMQRALEAPKAMGRKVLAQLSADSNGPFTYDVTNKSEMQQLLQDAAMDKIGLKKGSELADAQARLITFDAEYLEILLEAVKTGEVNQYQEWIQANRNEIIWAARNMSEIWGDEMRSRLELTKKFAGVTEDLF